MSMSYSRSNSSGISEAVSAINFIFGMLTDAARIEKKDISFAAIVGACETRHEQTGGRQLAIQDIHLASDGFNGKFGHREGEGFASTSLALFHNFKIGRTRPSPAPAGVDTQPIISLYS